MMQDLISRQAAIEAICEDGTMFERQGQYSITMAERKQRDTDILDALPSAQPEIIRCKDCKWWDRDPESVYGYCMAIKHGYHSRNWEIEIYRKYKGDFYCADAVIEEEGDDDE